MADFKQYDDIKESLKYDEGGTMRWSATFSLNLEERILMVMVFDQHDKV